jgi:hypothetical protein
MNPWLVLAGSAGVVVLMVVVAAALGFRERMKLSEADLVRFAASEGADIESALVAVDGATALARLSGGKLLAARVLGDGVGARVTGVHAASVRVKKGRVIVAFNDLGFPPLRLKLKDAAPDWLTQLARMKP